MPTMTGGQALMRSLHLEGIRVIFGLPGVQLYQAARELDIAYRAALYWSAFTDTGREG